MAITIDEAINAYAGRAGSGGSDAAPYNSESLAEIYAPRVQQLLNLQKQGFTHAEWKWDADAGHNRWHGVASDANVRRLLDLSTSHLDSWWRLENLTSFEGVIAYEVTHGALMWVPDDVDEHNADYDVADIIQTIQRHARSLGCDYVLFDQDGPTVPGLPTWEW